MLSRIAFATMAAVGFGGLVAGIPATPASAAPSVPITISWEGDTSTAADFQPERNPNSPHYAEMQNISVTVSQTTNIGDQAVRVSIAGFAGTRSAITQGVQNGANFVQAMQC